ncbi:MAG: alpha/beta hydrolase, partial [Hyphomonas sp.]
MTKTLLMIHGIGCGGDVWDRMRPAFEADGWTCEAPTLFPDRRVKQNPPDSLAELGLDDYISAMSGQARAIAKATGERPAVIGHSMGGLIAQVLAERGDVSQAVFLTPAQPKDCAVIGPSVAITFLNILLQQKRTKSYKIWRTGFDFGVTNCVPKRLREEIYSHALYDSGKVYGEISDGIEIDESKITIPTLTIAAGKDR